MLRMSFFSNSIMKIFFFIFFISSNIYSQNFLSIYLSPFIPIQKSEPLINNSLFVNLAWNPSKYLGNTFYFGTADGLLLGTSIDINYLYPNKNSNLWYFGSSLSLPFFMQIKDSEQKYYAGASTNLSFTIAVNKEKKLYFYIIPVSIFAIPFNWINQSGQKLEFDSSVYFYYSFAIGFRKPI